MHFLACVQQPSGWQQTYNSVQILTDPARWCKSARRLRHFHRLTIRKSTEAKLRLSGKIIRQFLVRMTRQQSARSACVYTHCCRFNRFAQGIYITLPYTLSVFMVRSFEADNASEESVGRKTGLLVSSSSGSLRHSGVS